MKKLFSFKYVLYALLSIIILLSAFFCISFGKSYAAETSDGTIENIYDETKGKFLEKNLNLLAKKAGYAGIDEMVTAAEGGDIKTANDFGHVTVKFGKSFGGDGENSTELVWIPTYLSNSMQGPILTLWLSRTDETAVFNQQWNNGALTKPSSNNYSTSKLRTEYLNNSGVYYNDYGNTSSNTTLLEAVSYTETSENTHRFQMYTTGILSSYIVAPSQVAWQTGEGCNRLKNDQGWSGNTDGFYFQDKDGNEQTWINDKLWLPSIYEVFDGSVKVNSNLTVFSAKDTKGAANNSAAGLWGTNIEERSTDNNSSWLRTARGDNYHTAGILNVDGDYGFTHVFEPIFVRPALHLNLKVASQIMEPEHNHSFGEWETVTPATCSQKGLRQRTCSAEGCMLENGIETEEIEIDIEAHDWNEWQITPATCTTAGEKMHVCKNNSAHIEREVIPEWGHSFAAEFTIDVGATCTKAGSKSKHCTHLGCNEKTEITEIAALQHDWGEWTVETAVTCEKDGEEKRTCKRADCGGTETRTVVHEGHKYVDETTPPTCTDDGYTTHTCSVCGNSYKDGQVAANGHKYVDETTPPTCTEDGYTTHTCSVCGNLYKDGVVKAEGHKYGGPLWKWNGYISATAGFECENCNDCQTVAAIISNEVTKEPTYTEDGERTYTATVNFGDTVYTDSKTETINMNSKPVNSITFEMSNVVYGDEIEPVATASYGTVIFTYSEQLGGTYAATKPKNVGTYYVKASVAEGENYLGAEEIKEFKILAREITVTINSGSSVAGDPLEALTATVTSGSVVNGDSPYTLSTNADKDVMGTYAVTGVCTDGNYDITFIDGVYIVSKKLDDSNGGGEIDIPRDDIDVEFKVTQSSTNNAYSELKGLKQGYWAQLWYRNEDGTLGDEYVDTMNCILTLKIPEKIIEGIRGGEEINREKIAAGLSVYYVDVDGTLKEIEAFTIAQKEDESWIVKFNYNAKFRAEIVFNAAEVEENYGGSAANNGTPWWVWLIVGLAGAAVIGVAVVIIVVSKKKGGNGGGVYDDAELKAKLTEQDKKLDEIKEIVDGGFNDIVDE